MSKVELTEMDKSFIKAVEEAWDQFYEDEECIEFATHTDGGVEMWISLDKASLDGLTLEKQFSDYVNSFDVDEEIELYRQGDDYRSGFTIRESLEDFEGYEEWLNDMKFSVMSREINSTMKAKEFLEDYGWDVEIKDVYPESVVTFENYEEVETMNEGDFVNECRKMWVASKENGVDLSDYVESWDDPKKHNKNVEKEVEM